MKTIAIVSQKGGAGKTTLALHLATAAEAAGLPAAIIDLDPQASAAGWGDSRQGEAPVVVALPHTRLPQGLQAATDGGAELVVIDLVKYLADNLPEGPWYYPEDQISDMPMRMLAAEITREKLYLRLHNELPYSSTIETESWEEKPDGSVRIQQVIDRLEPFGDSLPHIMRILNQQYAHVFHWHERPPGSIDDECFYHAGIECSGHMGRTNRTGLANGRRSDIELPLTTSGRE